MTTNGKKHIDEFLEQKLRRSMLSSPRDDFQKLLMQKIIAEHKRLVEETRKERIVKYVLGTFSTFMIGFTVVMGYMYGRSESITSGADVNATVERSNTLIGRLVYAVQWLFLSLLNLLGVSVSPAAINIAIIIILVVTVFLVGERLFLRGKYKSSVQTK